MQREKFGPWFVTVAAMMWAMDAPFRKFLTTELSSTTIVLMEHLLIAVCVVPLLLPRLAELKRLAWKEWLSVLFIGCGGSALATVLFTQSFHYLNPTVAILLQKLQPLIAILLAAVILDEKLSRNFWAGAILALVGAYLVSFPHLTPTGLVWNSNTRGASLAVGAAFLWGGSTVFGRFVLNRVSFQTMTGLRFLTALVFLTVMNVYAGTLSQMPGASPRDWLFVFLIAIVAGFVSLLIYYYGLRSTKASIATICELGFPFAAVIVNWTFLGAALSSTQIVGGVILLMAITMLSVVNETETPEDIVGADARTA